MALTIDELDGSQEAVQPGVGTSAANSATTIGGARKIAVSKDNASVGFVRATVASGSFIHSQDAQVIGRSSLLWDGTITPGVAFNGLAGIDLLQDGATGFVVDVEFIDLWVSLTATLYDSSDGTGSTFSSATIILTNADSNHSISIPFSSFTTHGPGGAANLSRIGAIKLLVDGDNTPSVDLIVSWIGTNGICRLVPNSAGRVIDQCGVCGGDDSSCKDCRGIPNGTAVLDRCGVCNGDGNSCLGCRTTDLTDLLTALDGGAKQHEHLIRRVYQEIDKSTTSAKIRKQTKALRLQVHKLQIRNWILSWTIPRYFQECSNRTFCSSTSISPIISEYRKHSSELKQMMVQAVTLLRKVKKSGPNFWQNFITTSDARHDANMRLADQVPQAHQQCS